MGKANLKIGMEHFMKANFKMVNYVAKQLHVNLIFYMKENGNMESNTGQAKVSGTIRRRS